MTNGVLEIKAENCTGCRMCELACSSSKEGIFIPDHSRIKVVTKELEGWSRPVVCLQCDDAMCLKACSVDVIYKSETPEGDPIIAIDNEKCIGCHQCIAACPFGAIDFFEETKVIKCDLCGGKPKCVDFCFYKCISFNELSNDEYKSRIKKIKALTIKASRRISENEPYNRRVIFSKDISNLSHITK